MSTQIELLKALIELKTIKRELQDCFFNLEDIIDFSKYESDVRAKLSDELYRLQEIYQIGDL